MSDKNPNTRQSEITLAQDDILDITRHWKVDPINAPQIFNMKESHPQTASILAQHEAANIEYERERNRDIKANKQAFQNSEHFCSREERAYPLPSPSDILDVDVHNNDRRKYTQFRDSGMILPLSYDTESSGISECSGSPISLSREKHAISTMWKKIVRSNSQSPRPGYDKHHDPLVRTDVYSPSRGDFDHKAGSLDNPLVSTDLAFAL
ncbi:hypothetical protein PILCRDRAFT_16905 [Piloderma croceum F 1598]|uniref:Uncharacterized protein n=1 Tax=Piloderma croceum (strain F 1598) TaxID=765440 RepID=A0A0C3EG66_PILCF|nr:hypothetical protein PILCRDRAFT_16905 [Piloderma croceum F 1598]